MSALVAILMGSKSDMETMQTCMETLAKFKIEHEAHVMSAHRTPERVREFVSSARDRGFEALIAAAGGAAALPGVCKRTPRCPSSACRRRRAISRASTPCTRSSRCSRACR